MNGKFIVGIILAKIALLTLLFTQSVAVTGTAFFAALAVTIYCILTINKNVTELPKSTMNNAKTRLMLSVTSLALVPMLFLQATEAATTTDTIAYYATAGMFVLQYFWMLYTAYDGVKQSRYYAEREARWAAEDAEHEAKKENGESA